MSYQTLLSAQGKRSTIIDNKHGMHEVPNKLSNDSRLGILGY